MNRIRIPVAAATSGSEATSGKEAGMADGDKFQVKLSARATAWVRYLSRQRQTTQSDLIREYF